MARTLINLPPAPKKGDVIEIRAMIAHPMETGYRPGSDGKVLARDLAPHGATANAVCPGFIWTPLWEKLGAVMAAADGARQGGDARAVFDGRVSALVPMQRPQTAEDVAAIAAFLASDAAANLTGQVIGVDGGVTI